MKVVRLQLDDDLVSALDQTADVRETGRSAVVQQLVTEFLGRCRTREADAQYERAYASIEDPLGEDFAGWEDEGVWPPE